VENAQPFLLEGDYARAVWMRSRARDLGAAAVAPLRDVAVRGVVATRAVSSGRRLRGSMHAR
jgi:hypothetical protein